MTTQSLGQWRREVRETDPLLEGFGIVALNALAPLTYCEGEESFSWGRATLLLLNKKYGKESLTVGRRPRLPIENRWIYEVVRTFQERASGMKQEGHLFLPPLPLSPEALPPEAAPTSSFRGARKELSLFHVPHFFAGALYLALPPEEAVALLKEIEDGAPLTLSQWYLLVKDNCAKLLDLQTQAPLSWQLPLL